MKIGIHLSCFTRKWSEDTLNFAKLAKDIGYEAVEIPLLEPTKFDVKRAKGILKENNLIVTCGTGLGPDIDITSMNEGTRLKGFEHLKKCINICAELGSKTLNGVLHSPWGQCIDRNELINRRKNGIASLEKISRYAKKQNVILCLELLNRYESSYLNTIEDGVELINKIKSNYLKIHLDTFHSNIEEKNIPKSILRLGSNLGHIHFADNDRGTVGSGTIDFKHILEVLNEINYEGLIVVESFVTPNCQVGNDVNIWRNIDDSPEVMAKEALKNIKELMI